MVTLRTIKSFKIRRSDLDYLGAKGKSGVKGERAKTAYLTLCWGSFGRRLRSTVLILPVEFLTRPVRG